jgi:hypothetical protein
MNNYTILFSSSLPLSDKTQTLNSWVMAPSDGISVTYPIFVSRPHSPTPISDTAATMAARTENTLRHCRQLLSPIETRSSSLRLLPIPHSAAASPPSSVQARPTSASTAPLPRVTSTDFTRPRLHCHDRPTAAAGEGLH